MSASIRVGVSTLTENSLAQRRVLAGRPHRHALVWSLVWGCLGLSGCFSGDYARRMDETTKKLNQLGEIASVIYGEASPVNDAAGAATGIRLRLPLIIDGNAKSLPGSDPAAQPPFAQLPGLSYSYEVQAGGQPAFAYFAAVAAGEKTAEAVAEEVQAAIKATFSSAVWNDATLKTPDGGSVTVKLLQVTGSQKFDQAVEDGRFDLYLVSSASHHVLIGWRAPVVSGTSAGFFENAARAMGSVQGNI
jgi:hypothetical protein